ncbi:MAG: hypothetical protein KJ941_07630 [Bacteroidetes bacterium]|nr:hypothetical protein [Bacteroidota bacterium]
MARQSGLIKIKGTLDNVNFYKTKDGDLARMKTSVDAQRIQNDPAFVRTRENNQEFGSAAKSGKLLRDAVRTLMMKASDGRVTSRLTQVMSKIRLYDTTNDRGNRKVAFGVFDISGREMLKGFNFNNRAILGSILFKPYTLDMMTGEININNLIPAIDIAAPQGATHVSFTGAWAGVDFGNELKSIEISNTVNLPMNTVLSNVNLAIAQPPSILVTSTYLLTIEFFQEINAVQYPLNNGKYNSLTIIGVEQA